MPKIVRCFIIIVFVLIMLASFAPIKMARKTGIISSRYFICQQVSVTDFNWIVVGDNEGIYFDSERSYVKIEGVDPMNVLNSSLLINSHNTFYLYGEVIEKGYIDSEGEEYPIIVCNGFDIQYPIDRGNSIRFWTPKEYLTLLDYAF